MEQIPSDGHGDLEDTGRVDSVTFIKINKPILTYVYDYIRSYFRK